MTKTQYYAAATLDGYIATRDDRLDWLFGYRGSFGGEWAEPGPRGDGNAYERFYDGIGALVSGSTTYEFLLDQGGAWAYHGKPYWVLSSRTLASPADPSADVRFANASVADLHEEMTSTAGGKNLWVVGGGSVASQFADSGLLDEVIINVVPVVLGQGKPLFDREIGGDPMQLGGTRTFDSGLVELRYEVRRP